MSPATKSRRPPPRRDDRRPSARDCFATSDIGRSDTENVLLMAIKGGGHSQWMMLCSAVVVKYSGRNGLPVVLMMHYVLLLEITA